MLSKFWPELEIVICVFSLNGWNMHDVLPLLRSLVMLNIYVTDNTLGFLQWERMALEHGGFWLLCMQSQKAQRAPGLLKHISKVMGMVGVLKEVPPELSWVFFLGCLEIDALNSQQNYEEWNVCPFWGVEHLDIPSALDKTQESSLRLRGITPQVCGRERVASSGSFGSRCSV